MSTNVDIPLPDGTTMRGRIARSAILPVPGIVMVHAWFGLNAQIIETCEQLAEAGFLVLGADLYHGDVAKDVAGARTLIQTIRDDEALATLCACAAFLRASPDCNGKVTSMGYCLGGGWALNMAIAGSVDAAVVFYGNVERSADRWRRSAVRCSATSASATRSSRRRPCMCWPPNSKPRAWPIASCTGTRPATPSPIRTDYCTTR
ncbi:dienelactone hydrolase family protein [Variovorax sp. LjRoot175]